MLYTIIQQAFQEHALFKHTTTNAFVQHDYAMHTQLLTLYHGYDKNLEHSYAFVEIKFDVVQNKQLLETLYFKQKVLCEENTPYGFILASNQAFETIFKTLFQKLPPLIEP
jgi:cholesterol transport system auxiliary component